MPGRSLSVHVMGACLSGSRSACILCGVASTTGLQCLVHFYIRGGIYNIFGLEFLDLRTVSLGGYETLVHRLFLVLEIQGTHYHSLHNRSRSSSQHINLLFTTLFERHNHLLYVLAGGRPRPKLQLSVLRFRTQTRTTPHLSGGQFRFTFHQVSTGR